MKSRNREVNIFNMSILDVLCGALGAFCFMMLALFPYYKPSHLSAEDKQNYHNAQQVQKELQRLRSELAKAGPQDAAKMIQKVQHALKSAQQELSQTQEDLSRTRAAMEQAQKQAAQAQQQAAQARQRAAQAQAESEKKSRQLNMKHPLMVQGWWNGRNGNVELFIHDPGKTADGKTAPPFDPTKTNGNFFTDTLGLAGPGSGSWAIENTVPGQYGVYYRLAKPAAVAGTLTIESAFEFEKNYKQMPTVTLSAAHPYAQLGNIVIDQKRKATFSPSPGLSAPPVSPPSAKP